MLTNLNTFRVDLHRVRDHNRVTTRLSRRVTPQFQFGPTPLAGEAVQVVDDEGNALLALVEDVDADRITLRVDWDTLVTPGWVVDLAPFACSGIVGPGFTVSHTYDPTTVFVTGGGAPVKPTTGVESNLEPANS